MERLMLKPREAAESIGIGRTQLYRLVKAKIIPSCRIGNSIRIPVAALRAWAEAQARIEEPSGVPTREIQILKGHRS
jgi:excisionase family DNA binding protein